MPTHLGGDVIGPPSATKVASVGGVPATEVAAATIAAPASAPLPATTTQEEDITTAGQRRINLLWEMNQALIAQIVVIGTIGAGVHGYIVGNSKEVPVWLGVAFGTVIGFYFGRTNHERTGGIGSRPRLQEHQRR